MPTHRWMISLPLTPPNLPRIMMLFSQTLINYQQRVDCFLQAKLAEQEPSLLLRAMEYALLLGGKRIRPCLVYATGQMLGVPEHKLDAVAGSIEAIHAYSLIHDDLPAMDNDSLRRGKPTCHIAFDEATAILAGDALQTFAFDLLATSNALSNGEKVRLIHVLAKNAGIQGMCYGQSLDLQAENQAITLTELEKIHRHKTGALLCASVKMGWLCSPYAKDKKIGETLDAYARAIGLAFQVQDDVLDIEGDSKLMGKVVGADIEAQKSTYPKLLGLTQAKEKAQDLYHTALNALETLPFDTQILQALASFVVNRQC